MIFFYNKKLILLNYLASKLLYYNIYKNINYNLVYKFKLIIWKYNIIVYNYNNINIFLDIKIILYKFAIIYYIKKILKKNIINF